ncbi:MAG: hypothetical protein ACKON9_05085, partial [Planctomycetaceae bacterium]
MITDAYQHFDPGGVVNFVVCALSSSAQRDHGIPELFGVYVSNEARARGCQFSCRRGFQGQTGIPVLCSHHSQKTFI